MLGTRVGNYDVTAQLGMGGMGIVYLAKHAMIGRPAAIKVLRAEMSNNRDVVNRFFNEARAATAIRHPGIVEIYDFGYLPDNAAYIIMEFLDGESLSDRLMRMGKVEASYALAIGRQIASALHAAHEQKIVHRDLKPENVFLVKDPEHPGSERIKLLDFGIAKLASATPEASQTRTGEVIGTPTFMSPEQCRGAGKVDSRSDLYSLGCLLYVLLTGRPPFVAEGAGDIIAHHLYFPPEPPSRHEPSVPVGVEQLVVSLLQKDPAARPATAMAVVETIDRLSGGAAATGPIRAPTHSMFPAQVASRPPASSAAPHTTLSSGISQRLSVPRETMIVRPRSRRLIYAGIGGSLVAAAAIAAALLGGDKSTATVAAPATSTSTSTSTLPAAPASLSPPTAPDKEASAFAAPVVIVQITIESEPVGAQVLLDGKDKGITPFSENLQRGSGARHYVVRKVGYSEASVSFAGTADEIQRVRLAPTPASTASVPKPSPTHVKPVTKTGAATQQVTPPLAPADSRKKSKEPIKNGGINPFE